MDRNKVLEALKAKGIVVSPLASVSVLTDHAMRNGVDPETGELKGEKPAEKQEPDKAPKAPEKVKKSSKKS